MHCGITSWYARIPLALYFVLISLRPVPPLAAAASRRRARQCRLVLRQARHKTAETYGCAAACSRELPCREDWCNDGIANAFPPESWAVADQVPRDADRQPRAGDNSFQKSGMPVPSMRGEEFA